MVCAPVRRALASSGIISPYRRTNHVLSLTCLCFMIYEFGLMVLVH